MKLETFSWSPGNGWSVDAFPELDSEKTLVLIFGSPELFARPDALREILEAYPRSHVTGCSSAGEIFETEISDATLSVAVARFESSRVAMASTPIDSPEDSRRAGRILADQLNHDPSLKGIFVLSDGLQVNGTELVNGLNSELGENVVVTGGLAGDGDRFERTWVLDQGTARSGVVSAFGLYGDGISIGHGSKGGWDIFGHDRKITRSEGNVLYELDGKPALSVYKTYLGERASGLPATALLFPLAIRENGVDGRSVVRTILSVDEEAQSLTFAGDVPQGWQAQLMKANFDRLVGGALEAAKMTRTESGATAPTLAIAISCVGRRLVLGERTEEEVEATLDVLPAGTRQVGFYSYGEISPHASGRCELHNQTMTLTTVSESPR